MRRREARITSHDVRALSPAARRARLLRLALGGAALALLAAAFLTARGLDTRDEGLLPHDSTGVVVLDLSLSISDDDYAAVRRALRRLVADGSRIGLVVFSDVAYELLPPGTPASELLPLMRLLRAPELGSPVNPWTAAFRAGTRVSAALALARETIERDQVGNPSVLLVSDLETAPEDVPVLTRTVSELEAAGIDLRVVALNPSSDAQSIFAGAIQDAPFTLPADRAAELAAASRPAYGLPGLLLVLGVLLFLVLAVHERFGSSLALPLVPRARSVP